MSVPKIVSTLLDRTPAVAIVATSLTWTKELVMVSNWIMSA